MRGSEVSRPAGHPYRSGSRPVTQDAAGKPGRGRPRSERARAAILEAAAELVLEHGLAAVSVDAVAARAKVSKTTLYRWWPTKEILALHAIQGSSDGIKPHPVETGSLRGDLLAQLLPWVDHLRFRPYGRLEAAFIAEAHADPIFREQYTARCIEPRYRHGHAVIVQAVARGEIPIQTDIEVALDLIYGSIFFRLLYGHAPLSDAFVVEVVEMVIGGLDWTNSGQTVELHHQR